MPELTEREFENLIDGLSVRPERSGDRQFLEHLYASTRERELRAVDWPQDAREAFLRQQYEAQHTHYRRHYPDAKFWIIESESHPVGRLYLELRDDEIRLMDIALLPEHKGRGVGTVVVTRIIEIAAENAIAVRLHVEPDNRAVNLYRRLGFVKLEDRGVYQFMEWRAG